MTKRKYRSDAISANRSVEDLGREDTHDKPDSREAYDKISRSVANTDDDKWTVVDSRKRRKKRAERGCCDREEVVPDESHKYHRDYEPQEVGTDAIQSLRYKNSKSKDKSPESQNDLFHNPFKSIANGHQGRSSPPQNPFSTSTQASASPPPASRTERRAQRKKERNYPLIEHSHHARLQSQLRLANLQDLVLYILADGNAPQWVSIRNRAAIGKVVVVMVPGMEIGMFGGHVALNGTSERAGEDRVKGAMGTGDEAVESKEAEKDKRLRVSPDDFYPTQLRSDRLPEALKPLADVFEYVWPVTAPGEHRGNLYTKVYSPIQSMLNSQIPKTQEQKRLEKDRNHKGPAPQDSKHWKNERTRVASFITGLAEQQDNEYVPHPAWFTTAESKEAACLARKAAKQSIEDGWVDTKVDDLSQGDVPEDDIELGSITAGRHVIAVDCEMCKAEDGEQLLTRISLVDWDGSVILDKLVKPSVPIKDYVTQWSGITAAMLEDVTTTLSDIQNELLKLITPRTILVGHSLNSDLNALKLTHPFLIDSGILYPHPRGPPYKQSLKWLAQKYLRREVQKGANGHDSIEDARTCLDMVKQKCEKGPRWGLGDMNTESIFKRLERANRPGTDDKHRAGAVIDWGEPSRGCGAQAHVAIGCKSDFDITDGIDQAVKGQALGRKGDTQQIDFVWGRLRNLELARGWWDKAKSTDVEVIRQQALERLGLPRETDSASVEATGDQLGDAVASTVKHIVQIYEALPPCTAFIVYSGTGDPREVRRLQDMQQQYRREYATKKWEDLSVQWTDAEAQALSRACQDMRNGIAFITVK